MKQMYPLPKPGFKIRHSQCRALKSDRLRERTTQGKERKSGCAKWRGELCPDGIERS
jgi:hypothetical protein